MRSSSKFIAAGAVILIVACLFGYRWYQDAPRRRCLIALADFRSALNSPDSAKLLSKIALPAAIQGRTVQEQSEFVRKALRGEISEEGINLLAQRGSYGPLVAIFPKEGEGWAHQAGVNVADCSAFKFEAGGLRTEVVLVKQGDSYRIVRCNNLTQLAKNS